MATNTHCAYSLTTCQAIHHDVTVEDFDHED